MKFRDKQPALYWCGVALVAIALIALPLVLTMVGTAWVRITNLAILFIFLALGLNIVVGFAGLLDLGYIAFYAVGAYVLRPAGIAAFRLASAFLGHPAHRRLLRLRRRRTARRADAAPAR